MTQESYCLYTKLTPSSTLSIHEFEKEGKDSLKLMRNCCSGRVLLQKDSWTLCFTLFALVYFSMGPMVFLGFFICGLLVLQAKCVVVGSAIESCLRDIFMVPKKKNDLVQWKEFWIFLIFRWG